MALDPNIALGVRPIEQPNMLGQMAQVMAMRQAQQEYENEGGLRNALTGGLPDDPSSLLQYGKQGRAVYESALKGRKEKLESDDKRNVMLGGLAGPVMENPTPQTFNFALDRAVNYGLMTPAQKQEVMTQYGSSPESIKSYAAQIFKGSITAQAQQSDTTSRRNADVTSGPGYLQAGIAREKLTQEQAELARVRSILTGGAPPPAAFPVAGNAPMGGGGQLGSGTFGIPTGVTPTPSTGAVAKPNVLATQVAPQTTFAPNVNGLNPTAPSRVEDITRQITQLAKVGGPVANQALEGLIKEYNVLNPAGKIEIDSTGTLRTINERSGVSTVVTGADGKPVRGNVAPIIKSVLDQTDPAGKRMIDVNVNEYVQGTGLGADGKGATPKGVIGISNSQIAPNYLPDPNNPQGVIPVPGSAADPEAAVPSGYRRSAKGNGFEFIPGGPQDPAVKALQATETLSAKDIAARNAKYPVATQAVKSFEANATDLEKDITELLTHKGLNSITGIAAGRMGGVTDEGRAALAIYNRIVAKGGFSELQSLRNASPTGGALGNISNQEGTQLKEAFATIDRKQEAEDVRKGLRDALIRVQGAKERVREGYDMTYAYKNAAPSGFTYVGKE